MISFRSLFSSSSGNSYFLNIDDTKVLVDVGMSAKKICEQLKNFGEDILNIDGICITHEHVDHIRGLNVLLKNNNIPVYMNEKTYLEYIKINEKKSNLKEDYLYLFNNSDFQIGNITIKPFSISHDAADPVGFSFFDKNKNKATIATDLGIIDEKVLDNLKHNKLLVLEANYDDDLIMYSPYPYKTIQRIKSEKGHLSNKTAANISAKLANDGLANISLAHVSKKNNNINLIKETFESTFNEKGINQEKIKLKIFDSNIFSEEIIIK